MIDTDIRLAGAILAGGQARRLGGAAKGAIEARPGVSIVQHLLGELARASIDDVIIVANDPAPYASLDREIVADLRPGNGPLGGIETALTALRGRADAVVFLPCDVPGVEAEHIQRLKAAFDPRTASITCAQTPDSGCHPLCSAVHNGILAEVSAAIDRGELSVRKLWRRLGAEAVEFADEWAFVNLNRPEELERWRKGLSP